MSGNNIKAVKHDEVLAEMESGLVAQEPEVEAEPVEQIAEDTAQGESATTEEQTAEEEEAKPVEEAAKADEEELTEEEQGHLAEKTKRQMAKLREEARRAKELEQELENLKKTQEIRKPLEEAVKEYAQVEDRTEQLPWEAGLTASEAKRLAREEIEKERRLSQIGLDADYLESSFPELNPSHEDYSPRLAQDIYASFKTQFLRDDSARLRLIAEEKLELVREIREKERVRSEGEAKIAKQEAEQAPPVSVAKPKASIDVATQIKGARTMEELEAFERQLGKAR